MVRKPVKKQKENPAGCAGEGKQSKRNIGEEKITVESAKFEFCDEITRIRCEEKKEGRRGVGGSGGGGREGVRGEGEDCGSSKFLNS